MLFKKYPLIISFAIFIHLILAWYSVGYFHVDEHAQILEFANYYVGNTPAEDLPWEFSEAMRPTTQVWMVIGILKLKIENPFYISFILRLLSVIFSLTVLFGWILQQYHRFENVNLQRILVSTSLLLWFIVYQDARFSSENWSKNCLILALCLLDKPNLKKYFFAGMALGAAFIFRFQTAFFAFGIVLWLIFIFRSNYKSLMLLFLGIFLFVGTGILMDSAFYEKTTLTWWNYYHQNIVEDKAAAFGVSPWYDYFVKFFEQAAPPISVILLIALPAFFIYRPKHPLTWGILPFLIGHLMVGHKELRFLIPIAGFLPWIAIEVAAVVMEKYWHKSWILKTIKMFAIVCAIENYAILMGVAFKPADANVPMLQFVYEQYTEPIKLYCFEEDPYYKAMHSHFYKRPNLQTEVVKILPKQSCLLAIRRKDVAKVHLNPNAKKVYSTLPEWMESLNINGWIDRTNFWEVYEL